MKAGALFDATFERERLHHLPAFDGRTYEPPKDSARLRAQLDVVRAYMLSHGMFKTLAEISEATGHPEASVSARLRDLRKIRFGAHRVNRQRTDGGLFRYQVQGPV